MASQPPPNPFAIRAAALLGDDNIPRRMRGIDQDGVGDDTQLLYTQNNIRSTGLVPIGSLLPHLRERSSANLMPQASSTGGQHEADEVRLRDIGSTQRPRLERMEEEGAYVLGNDTEEEQSPGMGLGTKVAISAGAIALAATVYYVGSSLFSETSTTVASGEGQVCSILMILHVSTRLWSYSDLWYQPSSTSVEGAEAKSSAQSQPRVQEQVNTPSNEPVQTEARVPQAVNGPTTVVRPDGSAPTLQPGERVPHFVAGGTTVVRPDGSKYVFGPGVPLPRSFTDGADGRTILTYADGSTALYQPFNPAPPVSQQVLPTRIRYPAPGGRSTYTSTLSKY